MKQSKTSFLVPESRCNSAINRPISKVISEVPKTFNPQVSRSRDKERDSEKVDINDSEIMPIHSLNAFVLKGFTNEDTLKMKRPASSIKQLKRDNRMEQVKRDSSLKMGIGDGTKEGEKTKEQKRRFVIETKRQLVDSRKDKRKVLKTANRSLSTFENAELENEMEWSQKKGSMMWKQKLKNMKGILDRSRKQGAGTVSAISKISNHLNPDDPDNSMEYINELAPGPADYSINSITTNYRVGNCTFGTSDRFLKDRCITAKAQLSGIISYTQPSTKVHNIAFGTSKNNLRSEIKKIEYCDWNRPHFYQKENETIKEIKQDPCFQSVKERFTSPKQAYNGPDFYSTLQTSSPVNNEFPSYYFASQVPKGIQVKEQESFDIEKYDLSTPHNHEGFQDRVNTYLNFRQKKVVVTKFHDSTKKRDLGRASEVAEEDVRKKNSIGNRKRKISRKNKLREILWKNDKESPNHREEEEDEIVMKQLGLRHKDGKNENNEWIKPSFNVFFKMGSPSIRV